MFSVIADLYIPIYIFISFQPNDSTRFSVKSTEEIDSFNLVVCTAGLTYQENKVKNCGGNILEWAISYSPASQFTGRPI